MDRTSRASHTVLVGRDRELTVLRERLTATQGGQGSLVLIGGEAGIGKTALVDSLVRSETAERLVVLAGHCYDHSETPPYGPWREIGRRAASLPDAPPVPRLDSATTQAELFAQAHAFLVALTAEQPVVLVLEDLHWADRASLDLLRFIAHGLTELPVLLIGTYRSDEVDRRHPLTSIIPLLVREAPTERIDLRPLDIAAAQSLVRAHFDFAEPAALHLAAYLIERTEGNALFMTELLRSLEENGLLKHADGGSDFKLTAQTPVPSLLQRIIDDRLTRLGDETTALLAEGAVIGQEVPLAVWEAVARVDEEMLLVTVERAAAAHLVTAWTTGDGFRFTHALIRDVLYEHVPALRRRRLHRQVAEALIELPAPDPDGVAYHLQRAGDDRAAEWLMRAAERAEDAYALVTAVERYEAALALLDAKDGDAAERGWVRLLLAALRRYEDLDRSSAWVDEAEQLAAGARDPSLIARTKALRGLLVSYRGDYHNAMTMFTAALDMMDRLPAGIGTVRRREQKIDNFVNRGTLVAALAYGGRLSEARAQGENFLLRVAASAIVPRAPGAIADVHKGLAFAYAFQGEPGRARESYDAAVLAYQAIDNHVLAMDRKREELILAVLPYQADDLAERERVAATTERMAAWVLERGGHVNPVLPRYARLPLLELEGRWREACEILEHPDTSGGPYLSRMYTLYLGTIARAQGDVKTAWQYVNEPSPIRPASEPGEGIGPLPLQFQRLAVSLSLDAGDLPAARGWLDVHRRWLDFMDATLGRAEGEILEAEWHRAAGNAERARVHAAQALAHATTPRQPIALLAAHRIFGILDTDAGDRAAAEGHFADALALADACRAPYERALTLLARAELAVAERDPATATVLLDEVSAICAPLDARPVLARTDQIAASLVADSNSGRARQTFPAGLTAREVEVLQLVASGHSNAEIAELLFISPRTVKAHVANIFSKIDVHNRAASTAFAREYGII